MTQVFNEDTQSLAIACTRCTEVIEGLAQVIDRNSEEFCAKCDFFLTITEWTQKIIAASVQVNTDSKFCAFVNYHGHVHTLDVYLTPSKEDYYTHIASSSVDLNRESAPEQLERIWKTLFYIASFNQLPEKLRPSRYGRTPEVMSA